MLNLIEFLPPVILNAIRSGWRNLGFLALHENLCEVLERPGLLPNESNVVEPLFLLIVPVYPRLRLAPTVFRHDVVIIKNCFG